MLFQRNTKTKSPLNTRRQVDTTFQLNNEQHLPCQGGCCQRGTKNTTPTNHVSKASEGKFPDDYDELIRFGC